MPRGSAPLGIVADLWRSPVTSFGGEWLRRAFPGPVGVVGEDAPRTARRASGPVRFSAGYGEARRGEATEDIVNTERCALTTFDPDTAERDRRVLKALTTTRDSLFDADARILHPGRIAPGDAIRAAEGG